jgi:hypothetical protein
MATATDTAAADAAADKGASDAATDTTAADKVVIDAAAADTAAADKAAADKAAADAANAGKTPEQLAAEKATADADLARKAADAAKAPETYDLKLPDKSVHLTDADLAIVAAEAKAMGLTNDQAQALVNARETQLSQLGAQFLADAKADPVIGGEKFETTVKHAIAGRDWLFPQEADRDFVKAFFDRSGFGNHKVLLRALARIGRITSEDAPRQGASAARGDERKPTADVLFPSTSKAEA